MSGRAALRATVVAAVSVVLAATSLGAIFDGWRWFEAVLLGTVAVVFASTIARAGRLPVALHPLLAAAALALTVTARFASSAAFAGFFPTANTWAVLEQQYRYGLHDVTTGSPPFATTTGSMLVVTVGVAAIALAVDLLAVSARRPTLAGAALLAVVTVPSAGAGGDVGVTPFLLAGAGFLGLLALEAGDRAGRWGKTLSGSPHGSLVSESAAGSAGWRIGTLALGAALVVPLAIPGADHSPFRWGAGRGANSSTTVINPFVQIQSQLHSQTTTDLLTVRTSQPTYLRLTALENFGHDGFTLRALSAGSDAKVSRGMPAPDTGSGKITIRPVRERVTATDHLGERFLPVPQSTISVQAPGDWLLAEPTATIFSTHTDTASKTWTVTAAVPDPSVAALQATGTPRQAAAHYGSELAVDLQVPRGLPSVVHETAVTWANSAHATTVYEIAGALQAHFNDPAEFRYDLNAQIRGGLGGFAQFLHDRAGYCEQFASTMVAMLRTMGIPARVAIGFTAGTGQGDGTYVITNENAHAWPEVWFPSAGWIRFEPTPLSDGSAQLPPYTAQDPATAGTGPALGPFVPAPNTGPSAPAPSRGPAAPTPLPAGTPGAAPVGNGHRSHDALLVSSIALVVLALLLLTPRTVQFARRRRRWREVRGSADSGRVARLVWALLLEDAHDRGVAVPAATTPRQAGRLFEAAVEGYPDVAPRVTSALHTLIPAVERARYGRERVELVADGPAGTASCAPTTELSRSTERALRTAGREVRSGLEAGHGKVQRLGYRVLPRSARTQILTPIRRAIGRLGRAADLVVGVIVHARRVLPGG